MRPFTRHITFLFCYILLAGLISCSGDKNYKLLSPNSQSCFELGVNSEGDFAKFKIKYNGKVVVAPSSLGFELINGEILGQNVELMIDKEPILIEKYWEPVYGEKEVYSDNYNEFSIKAFDKYTHQQHFVLVVRAYNEGIAFKYRFPDEFLNKEIKHENTTFDIDPESNIWASLMAQSMINKMKLTQIKDSVERPLLIETPDSIYMALGEANLVDFSRMKFSYVSNKVKCGLYQGTEIKSYETPWRFVMIADSPAELLANNHFILNLNEPNKIKNTKYILPGKVIREVTLTDQGARACVDFAAKHNLQYIEFDAGWYGNEYDEASDATTVTVDPNRSKGPLDLPKAIKYAKSKGVEVILYINRRAMEKQLDEFLPLAKKWGVAGLKYGFVRVGSQQWTDWLHEAVRKAARYDLMVDIHDEYRPTGYSRTYPNLMTQEGIRGDEESPNNAMVLRTLFTRMIAGAGDQTNCYFTDRVTETMGSRASQMAKAICIYSPWQFVFWYDRPKGAPVNERGAADEIRFIPEVKDLVFYEKLPTVWDNTLILEGYPGEYATIARKSDNKWFVGALTGQEARNVKIDFSFLDEEIKYIATVYSDDKPKTRDALVCIEKIELSKESEFSRFIFGNKGMAMVIEPKN